MGKLSRTKGVAFERSVARDLRDRFPEDRFPEIMVRRASQADRAGNSDVYVAGHPLLARLWLELTDADLPAALDAVTGARAKLLQAEGDIVAARADRWPVVVWHRKGESTNWATMRLSTLVLVASWSTGGDDGVTIAHPAAIVTLSWPEFLLLVDQ